MGNATERGIPVFEAPGESLHIDWLNVTANDDKALINIASKSYLDWYMLTQVRSDPVRAYAPVGTVSNHACSASNCHIGASGSGQALLRSA